MRTSTVVGMIILGLTSQVFASDIGLFIYTECWNNVHQVSDPDQPGWALQNGGDTLTVAFSLDEDPALADFESGVSYSMNDVASMINQAAPEDEYGIADDIAYVMEDSRSGDYYLSFPSRFRQGATPDGGSLYTYPFEIWKVGGAADLSELANLDSVEDDFDEVCGLGSGDGVIDLSDFNVMKNHFNMIGVGFANGDYNMDGIVDLDDFVILKNYFTGNAGPAVPEPATLSLLLLGACTALMRRRV